MVFDWSIAGGSSTYRLRCRASPLPFHLFYQSQPSSRNAQLQDLALLWLGSVPRPKLGILSLVETLIPANSTSLIFVIEACLSVLCVPARLRKVIRGSVQTCPETLFHRLQHCPAAVGCPAIARKISFQLFRAAAFHFQTVVEE